jgi:nucleotide-binding universal stress UspA family protein
MKNILVCTDGEEHTLPAMAKALEIARPFGARLTGLYVLSPYLKKFTHEIYAVGREECRDHLDASLAREGGEALAQFERLCGEAGVACRTLTRNGEVADEIVAEASEGGYDMLVMGAKLLKKLMERIESVNVPQDVFKRCPIPMLFVR